MLITFEGIDGSGKTTLLNCLSRKLAMMNVFPIVVREPGYTKVGEEIRKILKADYDLTPLSRFILFSAARMELTNNVIIPKLKNGKIIFADRYKDSSYVYQQIEGVPYHIIDAVTREVSVEPDYTFFIDVDPKVAIERLNKQGDTEDNQSLEFLTNCAGLYRELVLKEPHRWRVINGNLTATEVLDFTFEYIKGVFW